MSEPRSRRALLGAGLGAFAAAVAASIGRPAAAKADNGDPLLLGSTANTATMRTRFQGVVDSYPALAVINDATGEDSSGLVASGEAVGVAGSSETGIGVAGGSYSGIGVRGSSFSGTGVHAQSSHGVALHVAGRAAFALSGVITIPPDTLGGGIDIGTQVNAGMFVLLTPLSNLNGCDIWSSVRPQNNTIVIHMSRTRAKPTKIGWFVIG